MVTLDCTTSHHDGVTLVTATVRDLDGPTEVTIENRLDGPVWPPRTEGQPESGWTDTGFCGLVGPEPHALGYATPAPPAETPAELVDVDSDPEPEHGHSPDDIVRELGDPSPPQDGVPGDTNNSGSQSGHHDGEPVPGAVAEWFEEMSDRVARAEALADAETVPEATTAVRRAGGIDGVRRLADTSDAQQLRAVASRARQLAERRETATVPVETLSTLA